MSKSDKNIVIVLVNGGWGDWASITECSQPCGGRSQTFLRECDNPIPAHGGDTCVGNKQETRTCNTKDCPGIFYFGFHISFFFHFVVVTDTPREESLLCYFYSCRNDKQTNAEMKKRNRQKNEQLSYCKYLNLFGHLREA